MSLAGKHIMISGGSRGIGWATASAALAAGAKVTIVDLQPPPEASQDLTFCPCDVTDPQAWQAVAAQQPAPQYLFLNAGVMSAAGHAAAGAYQFSAINSQDYQRIRAVNLDGVVFGLQSLLPLMSSGASIVVTASLAGLYRFPFDPLYAMTKHGLVGLVKSLAPNLESRGIRLHALCPDRVDTDLLPQATRAAGYLPATQVAGAVCQLFTEQSSGFAWQMSLSQPTLQRHPPESRRFHTLLSKRLTRWLTRS